MTEKMREKLDDIAKRLGHTPVIPLGDGVFGKDEGKNPAGSIKDRAAFYIIRDALESALSAMARPWWKPPAATPASACLHRRAVGHQGHPHHAREHE